MYGLTPEPPAVHPRGWYTTTQAAAALGIDRHTVAKYDKGGLIRSRVRAGDGRRCYSGAEITRFWQTFNKL